MWISTTSTLIVQIHRGVVGPEALRCFLNTQTKPDQHGGWFGNLLLHHDNISVKHVSEDILRRKEAMQ